MVPICYDSLVELAQFLRLPAAALAKEGVLRTMLARHAVLPTRSESSHPTQLLSRQHFDRVSPLGATLMCPLASVANKRLTAELNPLDATLTKNRGRGVLPILFFQPSTFNVQPPAPSALAFSYPMYSICPASMANDDSAANQAGTPQTGFLGRHVFSTDHKVIGLNYLWLALFSVFLGLAMSLLMRIHLVWPGVRLPFLSGSSLERYAA